MLALRFLIPVIKLNNYYFLEEIDSYLNNI